MILSAMNQQTNKPPIIRPDDPILVTGASGFIGFKVVESLLKLGYQNLRCFVRLSSNTDRLVSLAERSHSARLEIIRGNLLVNADCETAARNAAVIIHLAAGTGQKSFPD